MKKLAFLFAIALIVAACESNSSDYYEYSINEPVFTPKETFRNGVKVTGDTQPISTCGKICFYNGYLYISDPGEGIHIVNNTDPSNPRIVGYIEIPGNYDLTVHNDLLYADALIDLLWFDISDPDVPVLKGRIEDAFPQVLPPIYNDYGYDYSLCYNSPESTSGVVVGWEVKRRKVEYSDTSTDWFENIFGGNKVTDFATSGGGSSSGATGSMSRFGLYKEYLYTVVNNRMGIFDLSGETPVKAVEDLNIGGNVETIFSYEDKMFMGTPTGMLIFSVEEPLAPTYCSAIWHVYGCDPVVVDNDLAYVTIHSGNFCGQNNNELFIVDVSDVYHPRQLVSYTMTSPKGLGIDNGALFLCDDGLKVFRIGEPQTLLANQLIHQKGMDGYDLVAFDNTLMMITDRGLYQYDYTDINDIKELSVLPITK